jgi:hypothetical protein
MVSTTSLVSGFFTKLILMINSGGSDFNVSDGFSKAQVVPFMSTTQFVAAYEVRTLVRHIKLFSDKDCIFPTQIFTVSRIRRLPLLSLHSEQTLIIGDDYLYVSTISSISTGTLLDRACYRSYH